MAYTHVVAYFSGGETRTLENRTQDDVVTGIVVPFLTAGTVSWTWGKTTQVRQALELRIYETDDSFSKKRGGDFASFIRRRKNRFESYKEKAERLLSQSLSRVFVVMPIQGSEHGQMEEQRIYDEYERRFRAIETELGELGCVAIRIDKEAPLDGMVERIKAEIRKAAFVVADLTDARPSCYYETGYADALNIPVVCVASEDSVLTPGTRTRIHFDIHRRVLQFRNHDELRSELRDTFLKNKDALLERGRDQVIAT